MKQSETDGLETLIRMKDLEEQAAARGLAEARERLDHEKKNLTTLERYLAEYLAHDTTAMTRPRALAEGHQFRQKLQQTVDAQTRAVAQATRQAETAQTRWASIRAEREAVNRLVEQRRVEDRKRERAGEQRRSDEQALQSAVRSERGGHA